MARPRLTVVPSVLSSIEHPEKTVLYYVHDPMCSWCWAFRPVLGKIINELPKDIIFQGVLGGLVPDTEDSMPNVLQKKIEQTWKTIQFKVPDTQFNFDVWKNSQPSGSTYNACRAVIAARLQNSNFEEWMILAIQTAYYLDAKSPFEKSNLIEIAASTGVDAVRFAKDLNSARVDAELQYQIEFSRSIGAQKLPSLVLRYHEQFIPININYRNPNIVLKRIEQCVNKPANGKQ